MKKLQEKMVKVFSKVANDMADKETREWPPKCYMLTYQPARPHHVTENKAHTENK